MRSFVHPDARRPSCPHHASRLRIPEGSPRKIDVMYACIPEIGRGFFKGVCAPSNATVDFHDPPPPIRESTLATLAASVSEANLNLASLPLRTITVGPHTPHHRRRHRGSSGRSGLASKPSAHPPGKRS